MDSEWACNPNFNPARILLESQLGPLHFKPVARFIIERGAFNISERISGNMPSSECVYAFAIEGEVIRIGMSRAGAFESRLGQYERDITNCITGKLRADAIRRGLLTPALEKEIYYWPLITRQHGPGTLYVKPGNKGEETVLLQRWHPRLNRQRRRNVP